MKQTKCLVSWSLHSSEEGDSEHQDHRSINNYNKTVEEDEAGYVRGEFEIEQLRKGSPR